MWDLTAATPLRSFFLSTVNKETCLVSKETVTVVLCSLEVKIEKVLYSSEIEGQVTTMICQNKLTNF